MRPGDVRSCQGACDQPQSAKHETGGFDDQGGLSPHIAAGVLGVTDLNGTGLATIRADLGGLFSAIGLLMLFGAVRNSRAALTSAMVVVASAFAGRIFAAVHDGVTSPQYPPLAIEAITLTLLVFGRQFASKS